MAWKKEIIAHRWSKALDLLTVTLEWGMEQVPDTRILNKFLNGLVTARGDARLQPSEDGELPSEDSPQDVMPPKFAQVMVAAHYPQGPSTGSPFTYKCHIPEDDRPIQ